MALVLVIIPYYNAELWIRDTLQSVLGLVEDLDDIEIIVVDDGSTDNSAQIIEKDFPFVHLIRTENQGHSRARNVGTKASSGKFI